MRLNLLLAIMWTLVVGPAIAIAAGHESIFEFFVPKRTAADIRTIRVTGFRVVVSFRHFPDDASNNWEVTDQQEIRTPTTQMDAVNVADQQQDGWMRVGFSLEPVGDSGLRPPSEMQVSYRCSHDAPSPSGSPCGDDKITLVFRGYGLYEPNETKHLTFETEIRMDVDPSDQRFPEVTATPRPTPLP